MSDQENEIQTVTLPALALRGMTVFPNMMLHFDVGREISVKALDEAMTSGTPIFLVAQRDIAVESPEEELGAESAPSAMSGSSPSAGR